MLHIPPLIHGTLREHYILLFGMAGSVAMLAGFVGAWIGARLAARGAIRQAEAASREAVNPAQIRELAESIETIGLEVERIAEAQRFVAKVLVERRDAIPGPTGRQEQSAITPH